MWAIATDDTVVCLSVGLFVTHLHPATRAEHTEVLFLMGSKEQRGRSGWRSVGNVAHGTLYTVPAHSHSPGGVTFDAAIMKSIQPCVSSSVIDAVDCVGDTSSLFVILVPVCRLYHTTVNSPTTLIPSSAQKILHL